MSEPLNLDRARETLRQCQQEFLQILDHASQQTLYHKASDDTWSLAEVLAHIANARQFFGREAARAAASPGARVGRTLQDAGRLAAVRDQGRDSAAALRNSLMTTHTDLMAALGKLSENDLKTTVEHVSPKFGRMTLGDFIQHFIVEHEQNHVGQARRCAAGAGP
jgi:uncharacterized damage-inducible protein DinB